MRTIIRNSMLLSTCLIFISMVLAQDISEIVDILRDASILALDEEYTFLGKLSNEYDSKSIFNEYGTYGSEYSSNSIWNEYGIFGGKYSLYSPFNDYTSTPPIIIKNGKVIGYLTTNKSLADGISPFLLKAFKDRF